MARRPKPGKCVHCLRDPVERNWDHVLPEAWYPATTPVGLQKWQAPSCIACNKRLEKIERSFLRRVAVCLPLDHPGSLGVVERVLNSLTPAHAKSERERIHRERHQQQVLDAALTGDAIPRDAAYPGIGDPSQPDALLLRVDWFRQVTEKVVRGFTYAQDRKFIEPPYRVTFFPPDRGAHFLDALDQFGETYDRAPGIVIRRVLAEDDRMSALFEIELWQQFKMYASVDRQH